MVPRPLAEAPESVSNLRGDFWSGAVRYRQEFERGKPAHSLLHLGQSPWERPGLAQRMHLSVPHDDHRLDLQHRAKQGLCLADPPAFVEVLQSLNETTDHGTR